MPNQTINVRAVRQGLQGLLRQGEVNLDADPSKSRSFSTEGGPVYSGPPFAFYRATDSLSSISRKTGFD